MLCITQFLHKQTEGQTWSCRASYNRFRGHTEINILEPQSSLIAQSEMSWPIISMRSQMKLWNQPGKAEQ